MDSGNVSHPNLKKEDDGFKYRKTNNGLKNLFDSNVHPCSIRVKTRIKRRAGKLDVNLTNDGKLNSNFCRLVAERQLHERVKLRASVDSNLSTDLMLTFNHPSFPKTFAKLSTLHKWNSQLFISKLELIKEHENTKLIGSLHVGKSIFPEKCFIDNIGGKLCIISRYGDTRSILIMSSKSLLSLKNSFWNLSFKMNKRPFTSTLKTNWFRTYTGSIVYEHDPTVLFGCKASYNTNSNICEAKMAFCKRLNQNIETNFVISTNSRAAIKVKGKFNDNLTLMLSNEFGIGENVKPSKFGCGIELKI